MKLPLRAAAICLAAVLTLGMMQPATAFATGNLPDTEESVSEEQEEPEEEPEEILETNLDEPLELDQEEISDSEEETTPDPEESTDPEGETETDSEKSADPEEEVKTDSEKSADPEEETNADPEETSETDSEEFAESEIMLMAADLEEVEVENNHDDGTSLTLTNVELDIPDGVNDTFVYQIYIWKTNANGTVSPITGDHYDYICNYSNDDCKGISFTSKRLYYTTAYSYGLPYTNYYTTYGYGTVALSAGQSVTIPNLPEGCSYSILTAASANYYVKSLTSTYGTVDHQIGTVVVYGASGPNQVTCVNDYAPHSFRLSEEVISSDPNSIYDDFTFTIYLYSYSSSGNQPLFNGDSVQVEISTDNQEGALPLEMEDTLTFQKEENVQLPGISKAGTYNVAQVTLKPGQSIVLKNLGEGNYGCYVLQSPNDHYSLYTLKSRHVYQDNVSDYIGSYDDRYNYINSCGVSSSAGFINAQVDLSITKEVEGSDTTREFTFNVYLLRYSPDTGLYSSFEGGTYQLEYTNSTRDEEKTVEFQTGTDVTMTSSFTDYTDNISYDAEWAAAQIKVAAGQTVTIKNLPSIIAYYIEEVPVDNYTLTKATTTASDATVDASYAIYNLLCLDDTAFTFTNTFTPAAGLDLTLSKTVSGNMVDETDMSKVFTFDITLTDADKKPLSNRDIAVQLPDGTETVRTTDSSGALTVQLKHGQSAVIKDLPAGTKYTVKEEEDETTNVYTTTFTVTGGSAEEGENRSVSGALDAGKDVTVQVNNENSFVVVPTGVETENAPYLLFLTGSAAALLLLLASRRRQKRR
jgi:hypothetical protein